ncbi:MAG: bifunctional (p)ppGpp synthetase/guanosine-3',5'-bis(diphosphate) 3'-pyrophosphohydrolase [Clostridia bacterium]|nr:bifunctional (p)ppGpp synthetase/guanosine-3',5'-bis(diphosphate) 3'-pyrophosphohydrolase [Clostridia bacterium]MBR2874513.1 bifunctional (p)ppGpp synthetase/guanosine-3',5'-bis(diphosphate) 3'-pyrophosphohydrolase [Clostridia bacterium]
MKDAATKLKLSVEEKYSQEECEVILRALDFAIKAHDGQKRVSGEDYVIHPILVAQILVDYDLDESTIVAALLHDVVEDTEYKIEDIIREYGEEVATLVEGVTKLDKINFTSKEEEQAENFRKIFIAMAKDIRVLLIKLADRLHNMRSLKALSRPRQIAMATETLEIYAKLAGRLGISKIKSEFDDLCLKYLNPEKYQEIVELVNATKEDRQRLVGLVVDQLQTILKESNITGEIFGRPKHLYSIYKKMTDKNLTFDEIYDLIAVRVIVNSIDECYEVLGKIHNRWKPIPGRIKDYIATPKPNMYQSLHTTVVTNYGQPFEIQIRTHEMHKTAEYGIAAHWKYKEKKDVSGSLDEKLSWIREIMEEEGDLRDSVDFLTNIKGDLYTAETLVFTPRGDVISLPAGSTPIDFAYKIHSAVGNKMTGALVNTKMVPISYELKTGDVVEVITNPNSKGPSWDWIKICKSNGAKAKIRQFYKKEMKEENIKRGKQLLETEAKRRGFAFSEIMSKEAESAVFRKFSFTNEDEMFAAVGYGAIRVNQIILKIIDLYLKNIEKNKPQEFATVAPKNVNNDIGVVVKGSTDLLVKLARCCSPVPGDDIVGFISRGRGITIHRKDCPNVKGMEQERLIEANWRTSTESKPFAVSIQIMARNTNGLLVEITSALSSLKTQILSFNARTDKNNKAIVNISIQITSLSDLETVKRKLMQINGIEDIFRANN